MALAAAVAFGSSFPVASIPGEFSGFDKLAHLGVYGLLATAVLRSRVVRQRRFRALLAVALVGLFGATDEIHQYFVPGRSAEAADWAADVAGAAAAAAVYLNWGWYRRVLEWPFHIRRKRTKAAAG